MLAVVDYGVGNLFSLKSSLTSLGIDTVVTGDKEVIEKSDRIILPGVGAFRDAIKSLQDRGLDKFIIEQAEKKPVMGICLGMQLLFEKSYEYGEYDGLGLISGSIRPIKELVGDSLKVPHIGWNRLDFTGEKSPIFKYLEEGEFVYFVHSYYGADSPYVTSTCEYGAPITASVGRGNVFGCQFHPEKSGETGLKILKAFSEYEGDIK